MVCTCNDGQPDWEARGPYCGAASDGQWVQLWVCGKCDGDVVLPAEDDAGNDLLVVYP